jgi:hypothetical protein
VGLYVLCHALPNPTPRAVLQRQHLSLELVWEFAGSFVFNDRS